MKFSIPRFTVLAAPALGALLMAADMSPASAREADGDACPIVGKTTGCPDGFVCRFPEGADANACVSYIDNDCPRNGCPDGQDCTYVAEFLDGQNRTGYYCAISDSQSDTGADTNSDTNTNDGTNTDSNSDTDTNTDTTTNTDNNINTNTNTDTNMNTDVNTNTDTDDVAVPEMSVMMMPVAFGAAGLLAMRVRRRATRAIKANVDCNSR